MDEAALRRRVDAMSDDDLIRAITVEADAYLPEALAVMRAAAGRRNIPSEGYAAVEAKLRLERAAEDKRLKGVAGWLLVAVVWMIVIAIGQVAVSAELWQAVRRAGDSIDFTFASSHARLLLGVLAITAAAAAAYGLWACVGLLNQRRGALGHVRIWLGLVAAHSVACFALVDAKTGIPGLLAPMILLAYLQASRRVRATYGETATRR